MNPWTKIPHPRIVPSGGSIAPASSGPTTLMPEEESRRRFLSEVAHGPDYEETEQQIRRVLESGKPESIERVIRLPGETQAHAWALDVYPLKDAAGLVRDAAASACDYSERYDSRERLALLGEARVHIGNSLDVEGTARELVDVTVPRFADVVTVDLLASVFEGDVPTPAASEPLLLRRAAVGMAIPTGPTFLEPGETLQFSSTSPMARCLAVGSAQLHQGGGGGIDHWFADDPVQAILAQGDSPHSLITMPIRARDTVLGVVALLRRAPSRPPFTADDLAVTEVLIARVAVCLDNARRFARERNTALALQRTLLPSRPAVHPAVETAARYRPAGGKAQVGGDWFDMIPLPGGRVGLVVGDVVGHGINVAATMGRLRTAVRTLADIDLPPDELLTHLDDIVTHAETEHGDAAEEIPGDVGATCLYAVYDPVSSRCSLASAGHPLPVLVPPNGTGRVIGAPVGPPLGLGSLPFEVVEVKVPAGSLLALYTDGLLGAGGLDVDVDEKVEALRGALSEPASSLDSLCDFVLQTLSPQAGSDDSTLLLVRARSFGQDQVATWEVPVEPTAVAGMRRNVCGKLAAWGLSELAFATELIVSELVTNAIRYASGPIRLRMIRDRVLICEVSDGSSTSPHLRRARVNDEGGCGLFLVAELTRRWGTRYTASGKTIWAEQALPPPSKP